MARARSETAKAFIHKDGYGLLQLRDSTPEIWYPSMWGLFGGGLEGEESAVNGLKRELYEELTFDTCKPHFLFSWPDDTDYSLLHFFSVKLEIGLDELRLNEGQEMALVPFGEMGALELTPDLRVNLDRMISMISA